MTCFHVHRAVLALDPNASEYFAGLFRANDLKEATEKTTRLEFNVKVAEAFPLLLDYLHTGKLGYAPESFVSLFYLADYFLVESLRQDLARQIQEMLNEHNIVIFYQDGVPLGHDQLSLVATPPKVLKGIFTVHSFLQVIDSNFFLRLKVEDHYYGPEILFEFFSFRREDTDAEMFCELVNHAFTACVMSTKEMAKLLEISRDMPKIERFPLVIEKRFARDLRDT